MNIHFIQRKLLMSYNIKSRIWKKQCSTKWMQYYIQILNLLTKVLLSHLKKKTPKHSKVWFPLAYQKSNTKLNLFSTPKFITASVSAVWTKVVQGKKSCKQQEIFRDWAALYAFHLSFNLHFMYFILITCASPALFTLWMLNF